MYFATFQTGEKTELGLLSTNQTEIIPLQAAERYYCKTATLPDTMLAFIQHGSAALNTVQKILSRLDGGCPMVSLASAALLAPIPRPQKNIFCVGKNYVEHALEFEQTGDVNLAVPKTPVIFSKPPTCVVGPGAIVKNHRHITLQMDYEVELAVIIGKQASQVTKADAYDHVFGYTIMNDVSARDLQKAHAQWLLGKGPDTFAPLGPYIVHKNAVPDPHNLAIQCSINGELRQNANTGDMVFDIPTLIAAISAVITLEPGDIIATGTPAGVGGAMKPPKYLQPGDEMRLEIEKVGVLINTIEE
ncbi:fumarylacetoacetate hydrolase family protein|uniref:2-keto-4-pentenoate hydratase/2-oxohepta-3-ene-1,7-dioic acid hydratase (Catechol pathway) n=1 Tax=Dendrosporobacter quercicolus TaxID=146817 RepID=A0A1G9YGS3_9FIRM|nr:fumarylacetoacetate hydrolase family protein [Dendrosporobacter quercicolus]NSL47654.1 fumarylacetoacetate hydrolase family protein [Dendrosporobacter quercicolus DSM 1736]SDN08388.1 2-keto-4-pentenoate hydratase/2-oxohepta-3-ene-1,7-dioic acid hydratase (catechol pathway) [Dendrosporobacter quercicolus]